MSALPRNSPWGEVQHCECLIDGVFLVSTASHGGVMVRKNAAGFLSQEARSIALNERNYLCFEEDCDEAVVIRELLDKKLWRLPDRISDKAGYKDAIDRSLMQWHPDYWEYRKQTFIASVAEDSIAPSLANRLGAGKAKAAAYIPATDKTAPQQHHAEVI